MHSPFSRDCSATCQHERYRTGCLACRLHDLELEGQEAATEREKCEDTVKRDEATLARGGPAQEDREVFEKQMAVTRKRLGDWNERCTALEKMAHLAADEVKSVCADNEPSELAAAFETRAQEAANRLEQLWRAAEFTADGRFVQYQLEGQTPSIEDLDRAGVPALEDGIASDGTGLQTMTGKTSTVGAQQSGETEQATLAVEQSGERPTQESTTGESATNSPGDSDGCPPAESLDESEEQYRTGMLEKLAQWAPPADFDDGSSQHPDPRIYYDGEPLGERDARQVGTGR